MTGDLLGQNLLIIGLFQCFFHSIFHLPLKALIHEFLKCANVPMLRASEHVGRLQVRGGNKCGATLGTSQRSGKFFGHFSANSLSARTLAPLKNRTGKSRCASVLKRLAVVENAVKVEPVGEFELKGIRRPLAAYNVIAAKFTD